MNQLPAALPCEVIEHVAFFLAVDRFLGPPSALLPLLYLNRRTNSFLAFDSNPHLYSRIFSVKFDIQLALAHFGSNYLSVTTLASELKRRCIYLKRISNQLDCVDPMVPFMTTENSEYLKPILWTAYLMMVENEGKNEAQLRNARFHEWIRRHWFDRAGTSFARAKLNADLWPNGTKISAAGMWLLWLFLRPEDYKDRELAMDVLKLFAFGSHRYSLSTVPWSDYFPLECSTTSDKLSDLVAYDEKVTFTPIPVAVPATLAFIKLYGVICTNPVASIAARDNGPLRAPDCVWQRSLPTHDVILSTTFKPGSMDGIWEGMFTYTDFLAYAELLQGGPPSTLAKFSVAQHHQTWKIREYVLPSSINNKPLPPGDPLRAFIPDDTKITEMPGEIMIEQGAESTRYTRFINSGDSGVQDIILTGEGHSAWGQFTLLGRVRPYDGFVVFTKEYLDADRTPWLYRGHIVGDNFVGRWRDTISPIDRDGYEGCFVMNPRK